MVENIKFEWDENKNQTNIKKHGISFKKAEEVFYDTNAIFNTDAAHSHTEERFVIIGLSKDSKLLTVCYCERKKVENIRIISAREATTKEKILYGGYLWK